MEWYEEGEDPDFTSSDNVKHVSGTVNNSYGGGGNLYSSGSHY